MKLDRDTPPPVGGPVAEWERTLDPWHADAMPAEFKAEFDSGPRREGWGAYDWCGNLIGWLPDGHEYDGDIGSSVRVVVRHKGAP